MFTFGNGLSGFRNSEGVEVAVAYVKQGGKIIVTIEGCTEDYFSKADLLNFLEQNGVIENADDYWSTGFNDTDGLTDQDDTFSTVTFGRS